ncbi:MAG: threonine/serine dehydratase [Alphaproteobacteria bacterium]
MSSVANLPDFDDVKAAAVRLKGYAIETPLVSNPKLDQALGGHGLVKAETLQRTGAFKFRGAYNRLSQLDETQRKQGVVAYSSGNHAQGVAASGQMLGIGTTIVMPTDAPVAKIAGTKSYGAKVVTYDRVRENREEIGARLAQEHGLTVVPPFNDPNIIAGQGTAGLELVTQARARGVTLDAILIPCSGGGLGAGCALAIRHLSPSTEIYLVEPEGFDDTRRSLEAGERVSNPSETGSICDALMTSTPGEITFAINRNLVTGVVTVTDEEVRRAMAFAFSALKLVVEPGGSAALAAALNGKIPTKGRNIAIICSGGNVDAEMFASALEFAR